MTPVEVVLRKLPDARQSGDEWSARCPAHDDGKASLSIGEGEDGRALLYCHAGCSSDKVVLALGLEISDLMPRAACKANSIRKSNSVKAKNGRKPQTFLTASEAERELQRHLGPYAAKWRYYDALGELVGVVMRWDKANGKTIRPVSKSADGWIIGGMPHPRPVYRLPELLAAPGERVYVAEGEKCCEHLAQLGFLATTSSHGSNSAAKTDWTPLAGREVVILPDNDAAGLKYAADVAGILAELSPPATVRMMAIGAVGMDLPLKGDVADWIERRRENGDDDDAIREALRKLVMEASKAETPASGPVLRCLADIAPSEIDWLWPGRVPLRRITMLVGRPGEGKSFLTTDMAARISKGTTWPDGSSCPKGSVILISAEDDPSDTIRPRLDAHGADVRNVHLLSAVRRRAKNGQPEEVMFMLADVGALEAALKVHLDCKLIVVDPIGSFLGGSTDAHRENEVRAVLAPVARLAEKYGPAVLVVAHRRKGTGSNADDLALGSRAFTGISRAVWHLTRDTDNKDRRLLLPGKNNLALEGDGLAFAINGDPAAVEWEQSAVAMSADDALAKENRVVGTGKHGPEPEVRCKAAEWLRDLLNGIALESARIKEEGTLAGYSWRTLHRAKDMLGIQPYREEFGGTWKWRLPET